MNADRPEYRPPCKHERFVNFYDPPQWLLGSLSRGVSWPTLLRCADCGAEGKGVAWIDERGIIREQWVEAM